MLAVYAFLGLIGLQLVVSVLEKPKNDEASKRSAANANISLPAGRSPGSISAIHSGIDAQVMNDARTKADRQKSEASDRVNQEALRNKVIKPEKVIKVHTKRAVEINPADIEI